MDDDVIRRLQRLEDLEAIRGVQLEYRAALDSGDFARFAELFAPDGEWQGGSARARGRAEIRALLENGRIAGVGAQRHLVCNQTVDLDAGPAGTATALSTYVVLSRDPAGNPFLRMVGTYVDRLVRQPEGWRITSRVAAVDMPARPLHA